jgi:F0F1-type ATP synthase delta subunit
MRESSAQAHARHQAEMAEIRRQNTETAAIANSNARAIQANSDSQSATNEQIKLISALNAETAAIANSNARAIQANSISHSATDERLDRLTDIVDRYVITTEVRQGAVEIRITSAEARLDQLENQPDKE